jgi:acetyl-CoA acetyltransferase
MNAAARAGGSDVVARRGDLLRGGRGRGGGGDDRREALDVLSPDRARVVTIDRFCANGLRAIAQAAKRVAFGSVDEVVAGGVEPMRMVPMTGNKIVVSAELIDRFPTAYPPMGLAAKNVALRCDHLTSTDRCAALLRARRGANLRARSARRGPSRARRSAAWRCTARCRSRAG